MFNRVVSLAILFVAFAIAGCESTAPSTQPAYQPADGRNLPPSLQQYSTDPQWPYNEHQGGGGRGR